MTRVSLDEALRLFSENNLELRLARSRAAEARGLARQARAFPNPIADVTREPLSRGDQSYSETYLTLSQRFEVSGERGARGEASDWLLVAAQALVRADSARLAFMVKRAFIQAGMAEDHLAVTEQAVEVFRVGERNAAIREAEGDISVYDLQRLRIERMRYENLMAEADLTASAARRTLALLILPDRGGVSGTARLEIGPGERVETSLDESVLNLALEAYEAFEGAVSRRPEVEAADAEVLAAQAGARVARAVRIPDITATGGYKRQSDGFSGAFLGLSVPLPLFDRRSGQIEASGARVGAAEERRVLTRRRIEADLRNAIESYRSLRDRRIFLEDNRLAGSPNILEIAQVAYDAGEMTLVELLDAAEALRDARMAEARLGADLLIALYDLERALGGLDAVAPRQTTPTEIGR
jgi:cobalt-zinc-cadmium efflux system outer membrane protein